MASLGAFASTVRSIFKALRYVGLVFSVIALWFLGKEVFDIYRALAAIQTSFGVAFLVVFAFLFYLAIIKPARRYLKIPQAVRPPDLPGLKGDEALRARHLKARARGIERYLENLLRNPNLKDSRAEIHSALAACGELQATLGKDFEADRERVIRFEHDRVDPLLAPLDDQVRQVIRQESLGVAVGTAVSPSGAIDAFIVLWRNVNLVARIAEIYYGRPGIRGTFLVLGDVSFAAVVASQVQGLAEKGMQTAGGFFGKAASPFAGPIVDGVINGLVTMRIGYLAMSRCRAFQAFTQRSVANYLRSAFQEAAKQSAGLASDVVTKVGTPILKMPVEAGKKLVDWVSESVRGWFGWKAGPEPSGAGS
jgi:putative membrane protein